jgi:pilin isopeptide linkage protein
LVVDDNGKWFQIKVPDQTKVRIEYYVGFDGIEGDYVRLSNKAYFLYDLTDLTDRSTVESDETFEIVAAKFSTGTTPFFTLLKKDQSGNPVEGVEFTLYGLTDPNTNKVIDGAVNDNGTVNLEKCSVLKKTTNEKGEVKFDNLNKQYGIYCYVETGKPDGYKGTVQGVVEFTHNGDKITNVRRITNGTTIYVTNDFQGAEYTMPVKKTINGRLLENDEEFKFQMKLTGTSDLTNTDDTTGGTDSTDDTTVDTDDTDDTTVDTDDTGDTTVDTDDTDAVNTDDTSDSTAGTVDKKVYTDAGYTNVLGEDGLTATITGTGEENFGTLYFNTAGVYTFEIRELDLTETQYDSGYTKDDNVYTATITVAKEEDGGLYLKSVTLEDKKNSTDACAAVTPTFDNTFEPMCAWIPEGFKVLKGNRLNGIEKGEFKFEVLENGKVKSTGSTDEGDVDDIYTAPITFDTIRFTKAEVGTHSFTIQEIVPDKDDPDYDPNIGYVAKPVEVTLKVELSDVDGDLHVVELAYDTEDGEAPQFVNKYYAIAGTGIHLDIMHYILVFVLAGCALILHQIRRKKHRDEED